MLTEKHAFLQPRTSLIALFTIGFAVAGCVDTLPDHQVDGCEFYPDMDYMHETWASLANTARDDFDVVNFQVQPWNASRHDWEIDPPPLHADWDRWPEATRPQLLADSLCMARGRDVSGFQPHNPVEHNIGGANTADHIAAETLDAVKSEIDRQSGTWPDHEDCCVVLFMDIFYAVGYFYFDVLHGDGHIGDRDILEFEGRVDVGMAVDDQEIIHEGTSPFEFYVKQSAKLFHVEATWDDPLVALDLRLRGPGNAADEWPHTVSGGAFGDPQPPLAQTIWRDNATSWNGDWAVTMVASDLARDVDYRITVTIFNWHPIFPDGYTAL